MAWTEQCKIAFKTSADWFYRTKNISTKKGIMGILAQLSEESGIPQKTLWRWWNELENEKEKNLKNEINGENCATIENNKENEPCEEPAEPAERPVCKRCEMNKVEINSRTKQPHSKNSKYYGLCSPCRKEETAIRILDENSNQHNGILAICPKCNHDFYINEERINNKGEV